MRTNVRDLTALVRLLMSSVRVVLSSTLVLMLAADAATADPFGRQVSSTGIRHSFLITGGTTAIVDEDCEIVWQLERHSRDGVVLPNGNVLVAFAEEVLELTRAGETVLRWQLSSDNQEISTAFRLENGNTLLTELGSKPQLVEIDAQGQRVATIPLQPETDNVHMQTRMARKRANGSYLVPHLLAFAVKEYQADGSIVSTWPTDLEPLGGRPEENWPFTAIELPSGRLLVTLTHGNKVVEFDWAGNLLWRVDNGDVAERLSDPCGAQRLANGNTVICSYGQQRGDMPKVLEVDAEKNVVWEYFHPEFRGVHEIHVLRTNGEATAWPPLK